MGTRLKVLFAAFAVGLLAMPAWAQNSADDDRRRHRRI